MLAVVSLVLRYRAARGEERQQIRWIAFVGLAALVLFLATIATTIGLKEGESSTLNDVLFFAFFIMLGIGIPVAAGIAVMRYRLWELDVILKKTIVATVLVVLLTIVALSGPDRGRRDRRGTAVRLARHRPARRGSASGR